MDFGEVGSALREIALLTFPAYRGSKISIGVAEHVAPIFFQQDTWLVDLSRIQDVGPNVPRPSERQMLPLSNGVPILPGQSVLITARPQAHEFKIDRFVISGVGTPGGAADWVVNDLRIGNISQLAQSGDLPGDLFATEAIDAFVSFGTIQPAMDVSVILTYIGPIEAGVPFFGSLGGTVPTTSPAYVRVQQPNTKIPLGFACVSQCVNEDGEASITIYVPPIDQATIDVAVDAALAAGASTPAVVTMIGHALEDRGGLVRDAYVDLVVQRAGELTANEVRAAAT